MVNKKLLAIAIPVVVIILILIVIQFTIPVYKKLPKTIIGWADQADVGCPWDYAGVALSPANIKANSYTTIKEGKALCNKTKGCKGFAWYNSSNSANCLKGVDGGKRNADDLSRSDLDSYVKRGFFF